MARVTDAVLQAAIVSQQHQTFAVAIKPTGRIDPGQRHIIRQRRALGLIGKLRQYPVGLVDEDNDAHGQFRLGC